MSIDVPIVFSGASGATQDVERLGGAVGNTGEIVERLSRNIHTAGEAISEFGRRTRNEGVAALGDMLARVAETTQAGVGFGRVFGPQGAVIGGLVGMAAAIPDVIERLGGMNREIEHIDVRRLEQAAEAVAGIGEAAHAAVPEMEDALRRLDAMMGVTEGADWLVEGASSATEDRLTRFREQRAEAAEAAEHRREEARHAALARRAEAEREAEAKRASEHAAVVRAGEEELSLLERRMEMEEAAYEAEQEFAEAREAEAVEAMERQRDANARMVEENREAQRRAYEDTREFAELASGANALLVDALTSTISGTKSAEDAFKGLLKGFLEMISKYAMMKAGTEFADAIASFARYDYSGGAQHLAAGVAFTAVAVATGVGAAAINTAPPQAKPAEPTGGGGGAERSGDVVINWNAPVYTSSQRAEMGRELRTMIDAGATRYGP